MAFLDNSGDIILDAVLTEAGRRRMANGDFSITKFALGDDEIDYSLYNKNHPSGSAYYDLTILQTPVFEAMTQVNAGINYGLLKNTSTDLLYLPVMKTNELSALLKVTVFSILEIRAATQAVMLQIIFCRLYCLAVFKAWLAAKVLLILLP